MKVFYQTVFTVISALSYADAGGWGHGGGGKRHGGGGGKHGWKHGGGHDERGPLTVEMIENECEAFNCQVIVTENLDCNMEKPERPDYTGMTWEERKEAWHEMKAVKHELRRQILRCACCTDANVEDLLPPPKQEGSIEGHGFGGGGYRKEQKIQHMLDEHCPDYQCPAEDTECTRLDFTATKEERKANALNCVCCQEDGVEELENSNEEDVAVILASALTSESDVQTQESYLGNPASAKSLSLALIITGAGAVLAMV